MNHIISGNDPLRTAAPRYQPGLDWLRSLAIIQVFLYHYRMFAHPQWLDDAAAFGWSGVDLFFVLSGYLIATQLFREVKQSGRPELKPFFIRRAFRILPPYLLVLALYFAFPYLREREGPAPLWKYLSFTQNIGLDLRTQGTFSHAWSLCIEEQFYLLLPFLLLAMGAGKGLRRGALLLPLLFAGGLLLRWMIFHYGVATEPPETQALRWYRLIYYPTWCRLDGLLTGVGLAAIGVFRPAWMAALLRRYGLFLAAGIGLLAFAWWLCSEQQSAAATVAGYPLIALGYGCLVVAALALPPHVRVPGLRTVAQLSYGCYLVHKIVIHVVQKELSPTGLEPGGLVMLGVCAAATLLVAALLYRVVEKPALRARQRLLRR